MKLVTFETNGARHIGAALADGTSIADFTASSNAPHFRDMLSLIEGSRVALDEARAIESAPKVTAALSSVRLLAPVPEPRQMRDFLCFEKHLRQARASRYLFLGGERVDPAKVEIPKIWYDQPIYYKCNRFSVVGTGHDIRWPLNSEMLDYELEFGICLGKTGVNISKSDARSHIFGYCIFNDVSARDVQIPEMVGQLGPGKARTSTQVTC
jgi:2-keto-4-pentenoate hydratase/2-oxohepta-3-ene-1,7-dioic acid hydratase in catechol pathway